MRGNKSCFIITPIGATNSEIFRHAKGVIESVLKPTLSEYGFDRIEAAYEINISGLITTQIVERIVKADLVIANLTNNNSNVMYELALRHVMAKPIIHICENGQNLPFDIKDNRVIFYENDMLGVCELKEAIRKYVEEIKIVEKNDSNPIYVSQEVVKEINKSVRKQVSIMDEGNENLMKITLNAPRGYDDSETINILESLGFYKQDLYERNHEQFSVFISKVSDFSIDWLYNILERKINNDSVSIHIERI